MKILIPLLFLTLGVNANEVVYGSSHGVIDGEAFAVGNSTAARISIRETVCVELAAGEAFQVLSVAADVAKTINVGGSCERPVALQKEAVIGELDLETVGNAVLACRVVI